MVLGSSYSPYGRRLAPPRIPTVVYGTSWCAATQIVRRSLERLGVPYDYVDLDLHPEASRQLRWLTGGEVRHPTVYIGGELLVEPTLGELQWALSRGGFR
jgi:mycoredoxin